MKKRYATLALILSVHIGNAQVTLLSTDVNAVVGESINYEYCDWMDPGLAGTGMTWDFSSFVTNGNVAVNYTAANASFPSTNITYTDPLIDGNNYIDASASGQYLHGVEGGGVTTTYSNPKMLFEFPLVYGISGNDTHLGQFDVGDIHILSGETSYEVDGWGTVITPTGTYSDVLRVKLLQNYTDSIEGSTSPQIVDIESYIWLKAGIHYPVVTITIVESNLFPDFTFAKYYTTLASVEETLLTDFSLFPNPTNGELILSLPNNEEVETIFITSLSGTLVKEIDVDLTSGKTIDLTELRAGVYFVSLLLTDGRKSSTKKIVKE